MLNSESTTSKLADPATASAPEDASGAVRANVALLKDANSELATSGQQGQGRKSCWRSPYVVLPLVFLLAAGVTAGVWIAIVGTGGGNSPSSVAPPVPPTRGAVETNIYRNVFKEANIASDAQIQTRSDQIWQDFFSDRFITLNSSFAYIKAEDGVKTEGQSYGMMLCVQHNNQTCFNQLWTFAMYCMYYPSGDMEGYFQWYVNYDCSRKPTETDAAPDGESWFAMALLLADARWGSAPGESIFNYKARGNELLQRMLHGNANKHAMFDLTELQVKFVVGEQFTDPSYHLPAFYTYFQRVATADRDLWGQIAEKSRSMWLKFAHPTSGLAPAYATFAGPVCTDPQTRCSSDYAVHYSEDAWRVISNAAVDYAWFASADSEIILANRMAQFLSSKLSTGSALGPNTYYGELNLDGSDWTPGNHSFDDPAAYALHGVLALAANASSGLTAWRTLRRFWDTPIPKTYYQQLCYHLSFLHCSGQFQAYFPTTVESSSGPAPPASSSAPAPISSSAPAPVSSSAPEPVSSSAPAPVSSSAAPSSSPSARRL